VSVGHGRDNGKAEARARATRCGLLRCRTKRDEATKDPLCVFLRYSWSIITDREHYLLAAASHFCLFPARL
jgi:hypothetical protein